MPNHKGMRDLVPWSRWGWGGCGEHLCGEGERASFDLRESWGVAGGGGGGRGSNVGLDFPGHKISKQLKSINMFILSLARD